MPIPSPVPGGTFTDTYDAPRSGGRTHKGVDIFAPKGTPVKAPVSGTVVKVEEGDSGLGGRTVWVKGVDGLAYYFAHLDSIGVKMGQAVQIGDQLGAVGNTGNAASTSPHLHFSINRKVGSENPAVNPFSVIDKTMKLTGHGAGLTTRQDVDPSGRPIGSSSVTEGDKASTLRANCEDQPAIIKVPGIAGLGGFTLLTRCQGQAIVGGAAVVGGAVLMLAGGLVLAVAGLKGSGVAKAITSIPGAGSAAGFVAGRVTADGRQKRAEETDGADTRAAERSARMASAQSRQEAAERRQVRSRQTSVENGVGGRRAAA